MSIDNHKFDNTKLGDRMVLASGILAKADELGMAEVNLDGASEKIFELPVKGRLRIRLYTSVVDHPSVGIAVRIAGSDAVRVATVYTDQDGKERFIGSESRVHRTGKFGAIIGRLNQRVQTAFSKANIARCCEDCGAPLFTAKNGREICAELCRKRARGTYQADNSYKRRSRSRRPWSNRRRW